MKKFTIILSLFIISFYANSQFLNEDWNILMGGNAARNGQTDKFGPLNATDLYWSGTDYYAMVDLPPVIEGKYMVIARLEYNEGETPLVCYNVYTGEEIWNIMLPFDNNNTDQESKVLGILDGVVYTTRGNADVPAPLYALNVRNGEIIWKTEINVTPGWSESINFATDNGDPILANFYNIVRIDKADGKEKWTLDRTGCFSDGQDICIYNNIGYYYKPGVALTACNLTTGVELYSTPQMGMFNQNGITVGNDGTIYTLLSRGEDLSILVSYTDNGSEFVENWQTEAGAVGYQPFSSQGVATDGTFYTISKNHTVISINPANGDKINESAELLADTSGDSPRFAIGADGIVYVAFRSYPLSTIYAFNSDLTEIWHKETLSSKAPALGNSVMVFAGKENELFALKGRNHPVSLAGNDQSVMELTEVTLDASASFDPEDEDLTYTWTAPDGITLSSLDVVNPTFTAPDVSEPTEYKFSLIVNDVAHTSNEDYVYVLVKPDGKYIVKFITKDPDSNLMPDVEIDFNSETNNTNESGVAEFIVEEGTLDYFATITGFFANEGQIEITNSDIIVTLDMLRIYDATFTVKNELDELIEGASVIIDGVEQFTDENGQTVFYTSYGFHDYIVSDEGYEDTEDEIYINTLGEEEEVILHIGYDAVFTVKNVNDQLIENAIVTIDGKEQLTDINGNTTFSLIIGEHNYTVSADGYAINSSTFTVTASTNEEEVVLIQGLDVTFTIVNYFGEVLPFYILYVDDDMWGVETDANAQVVLNMAVGSHSYYITDADYSIYDFGNFTVDIENENITLIFRLHFEGDITITDTDDNAIEGASVTIDGEEVLTNDKGFAKFWEIPQGEDYEINVTYAGYLPYSSTSTIISETYTETIILQKNIAVSEINLNGADDATSIDVQGGTLQIFAEVLPINATDNSYTWSISNGEAFANIDEDGLLTAIANGTVTVRATANDGSNIFGEIDIEISNQTTGIAKINNLISVYPNPTSGIFTIVSTENGILEISNVTGKNIYKSQISNLKHKINFSNEPKGIYFITIKTETKIFTEKIIIQ